MKLKAKKQSPIGAFKLKDLKYESGNYWVWEACINEYYVMRTEYAGSVSESCYDALELAIARVDYLNKN